MMTRITPIEITAAGLDAIEETKKAYQMGDDWANSDRSGYTNIAGSITDLLVKVNTVAAGGLLSPEGLVYLDSAKKVDPDLDYRLLNGQSENCFYPRSIVGISAKASEKEAAEKFVKFLFEEESQRASNDEGLAVNSKVYEDMAYWKMGKSSGDTIGSIGTSYDTGVSIKPATPVNDISHMLSDVDMVLIMTVQPGFGGQKYMEECTEKIREVRELIEAEDLDVDVQVDGGINDETMETVLTAGANLLVAGSYVFNDDLAKNVKHARERMDEIIRRID